MGKRSREKQIKKEMIERGDLPAKDTRQEGLLASVCKLIIFGGTIIALFSPLFVNGNFFFPFVGPKSLLFMGLVEIVFAAWVILMVFEPKYRPRLNVLLVSLIVFVVVMIFSAYMGESFLNSFWSKPERATGLLMWFHLLAFFVATSSTFKKSDWSIIFSFTFISAVIIGVIAAASNNPAMRGGGTIGNDSFLGTYLLLNAFLAIYTTFSSKSAAFKIYSGTCLLIIASILLASGARAAKYSFLIGIVLLVLLWMISARKKILKLIGAAAIIASVIGASFLIYMAFQPGSFVSKKITENVGESFGGRFIVWEEGWQGFLERPWLGWGPENFDFLFVKYFNPCLGTSKCGADVWYDRAHNIVVDTLATVGIIGFISYLGIFISGLFVVWKNYLKKNAKFLAAAVPTAAFIAYFLQNLTVFDMVNSYLMFFLFLGFIGSHESRQEKNIQINAPASAASPVPPKTAAVFPKLAVVVVLVLFVFSFYKFIITPFMSDYYVIAAMKTKNTDERIDFYKKALDSSPFGRYQMREFFADQTIRFLGTEEAKKLSVESAQKELDYVSGELEKSIIEVPLDFRSYLRLGQAYSLSAKFDDENLSKAEDTFKKAINVSPSNPQAYWGLIQVKVFQNDLPAAYELAEKVLAIEPAIDRSHLIVVQIAKMMGNDDLAREKAEESIKLFPSLEAEFRKILGE